MTERIVLANDLGIALKDFHHAGFTLIAVVPHELFTVIPIGHVRSYKVYYIEPPKAEAE